MYLFLIFKVTNFKVCVLFSLAPSIEIIINCRCVFASHFPEVQCFLCHVSNLLLSILTDWDRKKQFTTLAPRNSARHWSQFGPVVKLCNYNLITLMDPNRHFSRNMRDDYKSADHFMKNVPHLAKWLVSPS